MREITIKVCGKCEKEFRGQDAYGECYDHEKSHIEPEAYGLREKCEYRCNDKYPLFITVPMQNGRDVVYRAYGVEEESPLATANSEED